MTPQPVRPRGTRGKRKKWGRRWNANEALRHLEEWKASGQSLSAFAEERGLGEQRLRWWRDRLEAKDEREHERDEATAGFGSFVPVVPKGQPGGAWSLGSAVAIICGAEGVRVDVHDPSSVEPAWLCEVIRGLERGDGR